VIARLLIIAGVCGLMWSARSFSAATAAAGTALGFGFLLLVSFFSGRTFNALLMPRVTGYIVAGIVTGPSVLGLLDAKMVHDLAPVKGIAVCLIALAAGGEMSFRQLRPLLRSIVGITLWSIAISGLLATAALVVLRPWLPFFVGMSETATLAACVVLGVCLTGMSPAVVMALLSELDARGPVSRTMLGVVIAADLLVIVLFSVVSSAAQPLLGGVADAADTARHLAWEVFGSIAAGCVAGLVLTLYLRTAGPGSRGLFVLLLCVLLSEVGSRLALDPLVAALAAGVFAANVAESESSALVHDIEAAALPIYVVFFALAGAMLNLALLAEVVLPALLLVAVRAAGVWLGARIGATRARAEPAVRRWAWTGLLPQAGLALALALLLPKVLPGIGEEAATLVVGIVGINQLLMPVLLRIGLVRAREAAGGEPR
jgi:Kef-type K+ transport system membrane component KefB